MCDKQHYEDLVRQVSDLAHSVDKLTNKVEENIQSTRDIRDAWNTGVGLVRFIKWAAGLLVALAAAHTALGKTELWTRLF